MLNFPEVLFWPKNLVDRDGYLLCIATNVLRAIFEDKILCDMGVSNP